VSPLDARLARGFVGIAVIEPGDGGVHRGVALFVAKKLGPSHP